MHVSLCGRGASGSQEERKHDAGKHTQELKIEMRASSTSNSIVLVACGGTCGGVFGGVLMLQGLYYGGLLIAKGMLESGQGTQACTGVLTDLFDTIPEIAKSRKPLSRVINLLDSDFETRSNTRGWNTFYS
eukprot:361378-Amphidinium_carterae.1